MATFCGTQVPSGIGVKAPRREVITVGVAAATLPTLKKAGLSELVGTESSITSNSAASTGSGACVDNGEYQSWRRQCRGLGCGVGWRLPYNL